MDEEGGSEWDAAAALADPLRRALYRYVSGTDREVGRDEAARAVGVGRDRAGSQLDRLAEVGLLEVSFRRLSGRSGPGAGRPSKLYRATPLQIDISVPPRRLGIVADVFAGALQAADVPQATVDEAARAFGDTLGQEARSAATGRPSLKRTVAALQALAEEQGFQPVASGRGMTLTNCPFRSLVESRGQLVCQTNLALFQGIVAGLCSDGIEVGTNPAPQGRNCCVTVSFGKPRERSPS